MATEHPRGAWPRLALELDFTPGKDAVSSLPAALTRHAGGCRIPPAVGAALGMPPKLKVLGFTGMLGLCGAMLPGSGHAADPGNVGLPPIGVDLGAGSPAGASRGTGDLRGLVGDLLGAPADEDRAFTLLPSIGVQELLTDNVFQAASPRRADLVTSILPQLTLSGQTRRLQADITYAPNVQLYAFTGQQDQVAQLFNGSALLTAVPDTLFLRLRGYGSQQAANGNYAQNNLPYNSASNRVDSRSFEVAPFVTHRFGGDGTVQAGYTLGYSSQSGATPTGTVPNGTLIGNSLTNTLLARALGNPALGNQSSGNGSTLSNEESASYTTGENLGRFSDSVRLDSTQYSGTGSTVLNGGHQSFATNDFGYGLNRTVALLGSFGYEDIAYSGSPPTVIQDVTWSAGVRLTPNQNSSAIVKYGHKDGFNALSLSASFTVTDRLRVFANYSESLTSSQQELSDNLDASTVDQFGNTVSTATGAPTLVSDPLLGFQNSLYRLKRLSATVVSTYDRDLFSLTVEQENRRLVATTPGQGGYSDSGVSGSFTWTHNINPNLSGQATLLYSYTTTQSVPVSHSQTAGLILQTGYAFSPTLTGTLEYFVTQQTSSGFAQTFQQNALQQSGSRNVLQNAVLIGLRKSL